MAGGKVLLTPTANGGAAPGLLSPESAGFLQGMGLAADAAGQRILQFLTQNGERLDGALMQKALRLAKKFKGRESAAAEAALALEEKGIESDSPALDKIMDLLGGGESKGGSAFDESQAREKDGKKNFSRDNEAARSNDSALKNQDPALVKELAQEFERWFLSLLNLARADEGGMKSGSGEEGADFAVVKTAGAKRTATGAKAADAASFLPLFNQLPRRSSSDEKKGWILLPFEIERNLAEGDSAALFLTSGGYLGLFLNYEKNIAEKMAATFKSSSGNICFSVYFNGKKMPRKVEVSASESALRELLQENISVLQAAFGSDVQVGVVSYESASAFAVENLPLFGVEAFA
ncbi:MAG: hypothetical protein II610_07330 [Treponema sp.]|nr:hypothetical protein [Treponema sp.]